MVNDKLGKRMKENYENVPKTRLTRRTPVCIRIDGKAFHTFTKGMLRPFDEVLIKTMQDTTKYLCENIQGCVLGYTQSDEITLILVDYQKNESQAWFDYEVQKMCSISASMATMAFNKYLKENIENINPDDYFGLMTSDMYNSYIKTLNEALDKGAMFDSRCFNIPKEEVANLVYWRQLDATRNSIQMAGQSCFSHKELHRKTCSMILDMLYKKKNINWNNYPTYQKRGSCCIKTKYFAENPNGNQVKYKDGCLDPMFDECKTGVYRSHWIIDKDIPIFKGEGRDYIEKLVNFD